MDRENNKHVQYMEYITMLVSFLNAYLLAHKL